MKNFTANVDLVTGGWVSLGTLSGPVQTNNTGTNDLTAPMVLPGRKPVDRQAESRCVSNLKRSGSLSTNGWTINKVYTDDCPNDWGVNVGYNATNGTESKLFCKARPACNHALSN